MFVEHRFDVKRFLKIGTNVLEVVFDSPELRSKALLKKHDNLAVALEPHRAYVRKAQYSFGWDWGPKLTTSGIWRDIRLEAFSKCRIKSMHARVARLDHRRAEVRIDIELDRFRRLPTNLRVRVIGPEYDAVQTVTARANDVAVVVRIPSPHLWWPNGYGDQPLYRAEVVASVDGMECDSKITSFGIRTIRLLQEKDTEGRSFVVEVNGVKIFCKGADWIPADSFLPRIPTNTYERLLTLARDAHMNMLRVWGGGIYEQDYFYDVCDRLGLLVWQDFMFACGEYPQYREFLRNVEDEATKAIVRLRNHPSLAIWCGNNECEWIYCAEHPGASPDDMNGAPIFRDLLPRLCRTLDGGRPYWRSSPFGAGFPNDESNGNHHQWQVWSMWKDYAEYERDNARFVTEFGFQAPANRKTFAEVFDPGDQTPQSLVMEYHNKQVEGTERLIRFQASHCTVTNDFSRFIEQGQFLQAEALKTAVEHWRRRKFRTAGSLFWQLNDCWPVSSWSVIDSALRPKAAYYVAKRFYQPILVSLKKMGSEVEVWVTNDRMNSLDAHLAVRVVSFDGLEFLHRRQTVALNANASARMFVLKPDTIEGFDPHSCYVAATLSAAGEPASENRAFFSEPKHMDFRPAEVEVRVEQSDAGSFALHLRSTTFVRFARIEFDDIDVLFSDNCFDLDPGMTKTITFTSSLSELQVKEFLRITAISPLNWSWSGNSREHHTSGLR
jgi:beta-mannosidase